MDAIRRKAPAVTRDPVALTVTADLADPAYQAYLLLRNLFTITFILAGADKFMNAMIDWLQYVAPVIPRSLGIAPEVFLRAIGVWEIALGVLVALVPRRAAYAIGVWLVLIVVNLMMVGTYYDVALRDFGLALAALALARLASGVHTWHERHA